MTGLFLVGLMVALLIITVTIIWPQTGLAIQVVGIVFAAIAIHQIGFERGVSYAIFGTTLLGALIFVLRERKKVRVFSFSPQEIVAMALAAFMALTLLYTPTPIYGGRKVKLFIAVALTSIIVCRIFGSTRQLMEKTLKVLAWISVLVLMLYTLLFVTARQALTTFEGRFMGGFDDLVLSWTGVTAVVLTTYLIISRTKLWTKIFAGIVILSGMVPIIATGSRGPIVALLGGGALTFLGRKALIRSLFILVLLTTFFLIAFLCFAPLEGRNRILTMFDKYSLEESGRSQLYRLGWGHYLANPLAGGGAGSFADYRKGIDRPAYPHNLFLEVGGELGTIGLALVLVMLYYCVRPMLYLRSRSEPSVAAPKIIQWLFWVGLANAMVSFDIPEQRALFASIGFLAAVRQWPRNEEAEYEELLPYGEGPYDPYPTLDVSAVGC